MFNKISVSEKWQRELFMFHGIRRVFITYKPDSNEVKIFENFLREFFKDNGKSRIYTIMWQLDYNDYESKYFQAATNAFNTLLDSHWVSASNNEKCHFELEYRNSEVSIILK